MAIKGLESLKQLDLSFNVFGDLGGLCLSLAFRSHPRLRYLSVGHWSFEIIFMIHTAAMNILLSVTQQKMNLSLF